MLPATPATPETEPAIAPSVPPTTSGEHMIPKSRLDQEIAKREAAEAKATAAEAAMREAETKRLKDAEDYKGLYASALQEVETLKPRAETADAAQSTLKAVLESQIAELPEGIRGLLPTELTVQQQLGWISKNRALLVKPKGPSIGAGIIGGGDNTNPAAELSLDEKAAANAFGMSDADYAKFRTADDLEP